MKNNDKAFFEFLGNIQSSKKTDFDLYRRKLLSYFKRIGEECYLSGYYNSQVIEEALQDLLNQVRQHQEKLKNLKNGEVLYYTPPDPALVTDNLQTDDRARGYRERAFTPNYNSDYSHRITRQPNGQLTLVIEKEGCYSKPVRDSLVVDHRRVKRFSTLASFEEKHTQAFRTELETINTINSLFIQKPLLETEDHLVDSYKIYYRPRISLPKIKSSGETASFKSVEDCLLAVKCLALGLKDISDANYVHQNIKLENTLILPNGILQIIGLKLPTPAKKKGKYPGSADYTTPTTLIDKTRETVLKLIEKLPKCLQEDCDIEELKLLCFKQPEQPSSPRNDINKFIADLDNLLEETELAKKIQERIDKHIYTSTDLKTSKVALKLNRYCKTIAEEQKQEGAIVRYLRSSFFPDHDKGRKAEVANELKKILTEEKQNPQQRQAKISSLIQGNIGLFSNGRLREIALEICPKHRENLQFLSDKLGL